MAPTTVQRYFADTLHVVFSEIAYYRYLFPDSFFATVNFENVKTHSLLRGKSIESDQLLGSVDGACDAMAHGCLKTLVIGLSIHPTKYTYIRELYAFQLGYGSDFKTHKKGRAHSETTELFLQRLIALLREMEVLAVPIYMSMRMTLSAGASASYRPPGFMSYMTKDIESYSIYPQCGSARVGKACKGKSSIFMCALCVEGPVQTPPLGSMLCPMPMMLDVDEDRQEVVFVAVPAWSSTSHENSAGALLPLRQSDAGVAAPAMRSLPDIPSLTTGLRSRQSTAANGSHSKCECLALSTCDKSQGKHWVCAKCNRHCHFGCYGLAENASEPGSMCLVCRIREAGIAGDVPGIRRLAQVRKAAFIAHTSRASTLAWLVKQTACKSSTARTIVAILESVGLVDVDRSVKPYRYKAATVGDLSAVPLFSSDIRQVWTAVADV
ncbi:hypothetical protein GGF44_000083 [Coemansia sp. RSA 1694]|nr:hypothetical protein GGF44_000083 [Coemansia sp. RSA 1694]